MDWARALNRGTEIDWAQVLNGGMMQSMQSNVIGTNECRVQ